MSVVYGKFEIPEQIKIDDESATPTFARIIAEPFERGFGHTIGSSMRRMLLTALEAPSIVSVRIEGVTHEYMAVDGIIEDMTNIILNLKNALLRRLPVEEESFSREPRIITTTLEVTEEELTELGSRKVTLRDLIT
ncbi:MAG: DNA-directed RNA polymerase subunit alpha, partial [Chlamydiales bacterium]